jgi:glycosyltransferase involved in cell wall biosynthesis
MGVSFRVTVTMPVYNDGALLAAAAQCVRSQAPLVERLIIVDDGSTAEDTREALAALAREPGVEVIRHPRKRGLGAARNTGIAAARPPSIGFLDADDL